MAPESMSKSIYGKESDIYAFAVCAYEIIHERRAYGEMDGFQLIDSVVNKHNRPKFDKSIIDCEDFKELIKLCWSPNPEKRPDAHAVCKAMMKILKQFRTN